MKPFCCFLLLLLASICANAQVHRNQSITYAEYFINNDPGEGNGSRIVIQDGPSVSIPLSNVSLGKGERVYFRVRSSGGIWSAPRAFRFDGTVPARSQLLMRAESYVGTDPGAGNGTLIQAQYPGNPLGIYSMIAAIPDRLTKAAVRVRNAAGHWSEAYKITLSDNRITDVQLYRVRYSHANQRILDPIPISFTQSLLDGVIRSAETAALSKDAFELGDTLVAKMKGINEIWGPEAIVILGTRELRLDAPLELTAQNVGKAEPQVLLSWRSQSGNSDRGFSVERRDQGGFAWSEVGTTAAGIAQFEDRTNMSPDKSYCWRVRALGNVPQLHSEYSNEACLMVLEAETVSLPSEFQLAQNYPNPFDNTTSIPFTLRSAATVTLIVHDHIGREVTRLLESTLLLPGKHSIDFDANHLPRGMYQYTLLTQERVMSRTMLIVK